MAAQSAPSAHFEHLQSRNTGGPDGGAAQPFCGVAGAAMRPSNYPNLHCCARPSSSAPYCAHHLRPDALLQRYGPTLPDETIRSGYFRITSRLVGGISWWMSG
jgi:hypothetical protein